MDTFIGEKKLENSKFKIHQNKFSIIEFKYKNISIDYIIFKKNAFMSMDVIKNS